MNEIFGYVRVSGAGQTEGDGFARQTDSIQKFCDSKGWTVKRVFREEAVSGTIEFSDRPALAEAFSLCGGVLPDTIIVERCDRLARDLMVSELIFAEAKKLGIKIIAADSGEELVHAESDPTRVLLRQFLGAIAQWEKSALVLKLKKARERIRARGERCEGAKPYSMQSPAEFALVIAWIVGARERGDSFHNITRQLNLSSYKSPKGGKWNSSTVYKLYTNNQKEQ